MIERKLKTDVHLCKQGPHYFLSLKLGERMVQVNLPPNIKAKGYLYSVEDSIRDTREAVAEFMSGGKA